jgi:hypothetical protein
VIKYPKIVYNIVLNQKGEGMLDFLRIQDKIVSWQKIEKTLKKTLQLRSKGYSQQEVADRLAIDRTFISRLESIGELRKGQSLACVGFPVLNKDEIRKFWRRKV